MREKYLALLEGIRLEHTTLYEEDFEFAQAIAAHLAVTGLGLSQVNEVKWPVFLGGGRYFKTLMEKVGE